MAQKRAPASSSSSSAAASSSSESEEENPTPLSQKPTTKKPGDVPAAPHQDASKSNGSSSSSGDEDDDNTQPINKIQPSKPIKQKQQESAPNEKEKEEENDESDSLSDSESTSESDSPPKDPKPNPRPSRGPDPTIKPITSKPMDDVSKPKKPAAAAKPPPSTPTKPASALKRPAESNGKDSKRKRGGLASDEEDDEPARKSLFVRVWSDEDEIAFLKVMIEGLKKGSRPWDDMNSFHESIKKAVHAEVNRTQVATKIRTLKKKYQTNFQKALKGKEPTFGKPHDKVVYDLSKKIWGTDIEDNGLKSNDFGGDSMNADVKSGSTPSSRKAKAKTQMTALETSSPSKAIIGTVKPVGPVEEEEESLNLYPFIEESMHSHSNFGMSCLSKGLLKEALSSVDSSKAKELESKWKKVHLMEMKVCKMRAEVIQQQMELFADALKSVD
ncbi:STOREKEEPER protein-like [Magnolia sinica]|uniref:STOREKEEPER protein-like n=1 Tax=Magnolia sinica TaxID=86752 RepID=UPI00265B6EC4|nr:STOREKEEPER protein-like [Magnolia sinica]